jgi:endonuclease/exonuclease/phosphatase family metal-dependent hydrolase
MRGPSWTLSTFAILVLVVGCGSSTRNTSPADPEPTDARYGGDSTGGDPLPVSCDDLGPKNDPMRLGRVNTLELATWNLHNFPATGMTVSRLASLITEMDVDFVAFQEVADVAGFASLLAVLPAYDGVTSPDHYSDGTYQKTGYLWRKGTFALVDSISLFGNDSYTFPRPPFQARFDARMCDGSTRRIVAIDLHLKAGITTEDETRRRQAVDLLKSYIDGLVAQGNADVVSLGDYNDSVVAASDIFDAFLNDAADYTVETQSLDDGAEYTYITYTAFLDHLIMTSPLAAAVASTTVVHLDELVTSYSYRDEISDHRPVVSVLLR